MSKVLFIFLSILLFCSNTHAEGTASLIKDTFKNINPLDIWKFSPVIGLRPISLAIERKSDGHTGILTNDDNLGDRNIGDLLYFTLNIESPAWMFSKRYGVSLRSQTQSIDIFRQEVPKSPSEPFDEAIDLGTSVKGYYSYIGPALFRVMDQNISPGLTERWGVGLVYWKAYFSGDIILAQDNNATNIMPRTNISDAIDNAVGPIVFFQWLGEHMVFELSFANVKFSNAQYNSELEEVNLSIGITF